MRQFQHLPLNVNSSTCYEVSPSISAVFLSKPTFILHVLLTNELMQQITMKYQYYSLVKQYIG